METMANIVWEDTFKPIVEDNAIICDPVEISIETAKKIDSENPSQHIWTVVDFENLKFISGINENIAYKNEDGDALFVVTLKPHNRCRIFVSDSDIDNIPFVPKTLEHKLLEEISDSVNGLLQSSEKNSIDGFIEGIEKNPIDVYYAGSIESLIRVAQNDPDLEKYLQKKGWTKLYNALLSVDIPEVPS